METEHKFNKGQCTWINVDASEQESIALLRDKYKISDEILTYSLDINERARLEYDSEADTMFLVFNVPKKAKHHDHFDATPMAFILRRSELFTVTNQDSQYVADMMKKILRRNEVITPHLFLFKILFLISDAYFPLIDEVNNDRRVLTRKLEKKTTNQHLLELSNLQIGQVYLLSATRQNTTLLEQMAGQTMSRKLSEIEREQLEDALIEARQAQEMTTLASQILDLLADTYNSVLNNNLNDTMKILTIWSLLMAVPTIVTGFFGMNVELPFQKSPAGWIITMGITVILTIWLVIILWRRIK